MGRPKTIGDKGIRTNIFLFPKQKKQLAELATPGKREVSSIIRKAIEFFYNSKK